MTYLQTVESSTSKVPVNHKNLLCVQYIPYQRESMTAFIEVISTQTMGRYELVAQGTWQPFASLVRKLPRNRNEYIPAPVVHRKQPGNPPSNENNAEHTLTYAIIVNELQSRML